MVSPVPLHRGAVAERNPGEIPAATPGTDKSRLRGTPQQAPRSAFAPWTLLALVYSALAALFTWPLAARLGDAVVSPIDSVDSTWRLGRAQERLLHAPWRLFDADVFHPYPRSYLFDELIVGAAIVTLPLRLITANPVAIYNLAILLTFVLSALAMYALARHFRCSPIAAFAAGLIYAFAPLRFGQLDHVGLLSAQYFPLIILLLDRLFTAPRRRDAALLALSLTLQALSSQYYALYLPFVVGGFVALRLVQDGARRRLPGRATWAGLLAAGGMAGCAILPFFLSYLAVRRDYDFARSIESNLRYSASIASFFTASEWNLVWGPLTAPLRDLGPYSPERDLLVGATALLLALSGAATAWRHPLAQYLLMLGGGGALLAFGPVLYRTSDPTSGVFGPLPYHYLYYHLPLFDAMRVPARLGILYALSVAGLAGFGLHWLLGRMAAANSSRAPGSMALPSGLRARGALRWGVVAVVIGGIVLESTNRPRPLTTLESGPTLPPVYRWLAAQPATVVVELPFHAKRDRHNNRVQYFSLFHNHALLNGSADIVPPGYWSLAEELHRGPTPRSLAILQGLGVTHIVVHDDQTLPRVAERTRYVLDNHPDLTPKVADFGVDAVYRLATNDHYARLRAAIPREATVYLAQDVAQETYIGMLGWTLRENPLYARVPTGFGQRIIGPPQPGARYDYAVLHLRDDPAAVGFAGTTLIWEDEVARVYQNIGP